MPSIDFGGCLANYWFIWSINGLGSIFSLLINVAVSYFFMKYFQFLAHGAPSPPKKPSSQFSNFQNAAQPNNYRVGVWGDPSMTGGVLNAHPI